MTDFVNQDLHVGDIVAYIKSVKIEDKPKTCKFVGIIDKVMPKTVKITPITKPDKYISDDMLEEIDIIARYLINNEITKYDEIRLNIKDVITVIYSNEELEECKKEYDSKNKSV
jgi:hypothetical protein|uniref:Uncharacterized protein n=1 Tax=virus sp. ctmTa7 TaxID=2828255 RepID=A0A8S5RCP4_9VIRU|nr:MAG TPA: hypothetical protein [virus sp. ctmTa7]